MHIPTTNQGAHDWLQISQTPLFEDISPPSKSSPRREGLSRWCNSELQTDRIMLYFYIYVFHGISFSLPATL